MDARASGRRLRAMIELSDVRKSYGTTKALDGLSLSVARGEIFGLLGPNGAGKSTAMHVLVGLLRPDSGTVRVLDGDPPSAPLRARIGIAPQSLALYEELTGTREPASSSRACTASGQRLDAAVDAALEFVRLPDRQRDRVGTYSGGMQRRLNIACAIVHDPSSCCSTSRRSASTRSRAMRSSTTCWRCARAERPCCTRRTTWKRPSGCATASASWTTAGCSRSDTPDGLVHAHGGKPRLLVRRNGSEQHVEARRRARHPQRARARSAARCVPPRARDARAGVPEPDRPLACVD